MNSEDFYTGLAPFYRQYSLKRQKFLDQIDNLIILSNDHAKTMLDVGSADGIRARNIAKRIGIEFLVLTEPNKALFNLCEEQEYVEKIRVSAENINLPYKFDLITCLWNVLGHVKGDTLRIKALKNISRNLEKNGKVFLDVNNRYNVREYGVINFLQNLMKDSFSPDEKNGDFYFDIKVDGKIIPAQGHVFNYKEILQIIEKSGLKIRNQYSIDYSTGQLRKSLFEGQFLFELYK